MASSTATHTDSVEAFLRARTVTLGVWATYLTCVFGGIYYLWTWNRPHRTALLVILVIAATYSFGVARAPRNRLVHWRRREAFFLSWSAAMVVALSTMAALDGGATSPIA